MATSNQPKIVLSAEDRTAAAFAAVGRNVDKLGFNLGTLKGAAVGALGALAVPVSAGAIVALASEAARAVDEFNDLKDVTGSSVESISALDRIARETGSSFETVSTALVKFNGVLKDADPDKGAGAVLKAMNLDIEELKRLDPAEALRQVAVAMDGFADGPEKGRAYLELFGKSARDIAPFVKDLATQSRLVGVVSDSSAEEVEKFNKELFRLQAAATDAGRAITIDVITGLNQSIEKFRHARDEGKGYLDLLVDIAKYASLATGPAGAIGAAARGAFAGSPAGSRSASGLITNESDQSAAELAKLARGAPPKMSLSLPPTSSGSGSRGGRSGGGGSAAARDPYAEGLRYLAGLKNQLQATDELTVYEKLLADIRAGSIGKLTPQLEEQLKATARQIDLDKEINVATKQFIDLNEAAARAQQELKDEGLGFFEATRTPIERLNIELARQDELLRKLGPAYKDVYMRAQEAAQDRYEAEAKVTEKISELDQFTQRAAQNMQDYLGNSFQQIMEGNFDNIGDSFVSMLNNMVAQAAAAQLGKYLFGDLLTGKSGGGNGAIGDFLGSAASSLFGGFKAEGGPVQSGKGYIVGERGPEWFEPATSGTVVPNHALGGGTSHNYNYNISVSMPQGASRATAQQFGRDISRQLAIANSRNG